MKRAVLGSVKRARPTGEEANSDGAMVFVKGNWLFCSYNCDAFTEDKGFLVLKKKGRKGLPTCFNLGYAPFPTWKCDELRATNCDGFIERKIVFLPK